MYVIIRRCDGAVKPQQIARRAPRQFLPIIGNVEGFRGFHLADTGVDERASVTLYADKAAGYKVQLASSTWVRKSGLAPLVPNSPQVTPGEDAAWGILRGHPQSHPRTARFLGAGSSPTVQTVPSCRRASRPVACCDEPTADPTGQSTSVDYSQPCPSHAGVR
jgi:hypothetical protein